MAGAVLWYEAALSTNVDYFWTGEKIHNLSYTSKFRIDKWFLKKEFSLLVVLINIAIDNET